MIDKVLKGDVGGGSERGRRRQRRVVGVVGGRCRGNVFLGLNEEDPSTEGTL